MAPISRAMCELGAGRAGSGALPRPAAGSTTSAAKGGGPPRRTIREIWAIMFGRHVSDWGGICALLRYLLLR